MRRFALIGAAGYIAPRHMEAIRNTGNELVAALDPHDAVGVLDRYFPQADFFTEFERFDRHLDKLRRAGQGVHYISIASPNYLHDSHIRFALRLGADAVCEKPVVLNPWNIDGLQELEWETGRRVNVILQLRLHPTVVELREWVQEAPLGHRFDVTLTYITPRGRWYLYSWKGDERKSGGIATNIGVHLFDMLGFVFGPAVESRLHLRTPTRAAGLLEYERARVKWFLSVEPEDVPEAARGKGRVGFRLMSVDGRQIEFSDGFEHLHTRSYEELLAGRGFGLQEARPAIEVVAEIRQGPVVPEGERHPLVVEKLP